MTASLNQSGSDSSRDMLVYRCRLIGERNAPARAAIVHRSTRLRRLAYTTRKAVPNIPHITEPLRRAAAMPLYEETHTNRGSRHRGIGVGDCLRSRPRSRWWARPRLLGGAIDRQHNGNDNDGLDLDDER